MPNNNLIVKEGTTPELSISIKGGSNVIYQWYLNDSIVGGETSPTYYIYYINIFQQGEYYCLVKDGKYSLKGPVTNIIVQKKIEIISQPLSYVKTEGTFADFYVNAVGNYPLTYQWYKYNNKNGIIQEYALDGETKPSFFIEPITQNDTSEYYVIIKDSYNNELKSNMCSLTVNKVPIIIQQPVSSIVNAGESITLSVSIEYGTSPYTYNWFLDDLSIFTNENNASTSNNFEIRIFNKTYVGNYYVVITDSNGINVASNTVILTINILTNIIKQPSNIILLEGANGILSVETTGPLPLSYAWYKDNTLIEGVNKPTYIINNSNITDNGSYYLIIEVAPNNYINSNVAFVKIDTTPIIIEQSLSTQQTETSYIDLFVITNENYLYYSFQWYFNDIIIDGATSSVYSISNLLQNNAGKYHVVITNLTNIQTKSKDIFLTINSLPAITCLTNNVLNLTESDTIDIQMKTIGGTPPYSFQWYKTQTIGSDIYGFLTYTYLISDFTNENYYKTNLIATMDTGEYFLIVKDTSNVYARSSKINVSVTAKFIINNQPQTQITILSNDVIFSVNHSGYLPYRYQWYVNDIPISNATNSLYKIQYAGLNDEGNYYVKIWEGYQLSDSYLYGSTSQISNSVTLTVYKDPFIYKQPLSQTVDENKPVNFEVIAYGVNPLQYQWYFNNTIIENTDNMKYRIESASKNDKGNYNVVIVDKKKNILTSDYASLNVLEPIVCFKEDTKILTIQGYVPIQELRRGDLIKTLNHDYKKIYKIACSQIHHSFSYTRNKDQLYICHKEKYEELFEDLIITGGHSILVDEFKNQEEKEKNRDLFFGEIFKTDDKYRLLACVDERTSVYEKDGVYNIYHFALENKDYYVNNGVYANGLLVETCSKRYLTEISDMTIIG